MDLAVNSVVEPWHRCEESGFTELDVLDELQDVATVKRALYALDLGCCDQELFKDVGRREVRNI